MDKLAPGSMQNASNWGWNASSDPCIDNWVGVTCDKENKTVKKIVLEQLNLSGILDTESVCKVSNLLVLSLNYNNLTGILQPEISNCKRLTHLYLAGNRFSGDLPDSLTELLNLRRIVIPNNEFSGELPDFSRLTGLLSFLAQNNRFSGELPEFNYHELDGFSIANNDFTGRIPDDTGRFAANSFVGNPRLCGKQLPQSCRTIKNRSKLKEILIYSGFAILILIIVILIALLSLKKPKHGDQKNVSDSGSRARSEFSITSVESGGVSSSMVVLSSPVVNGLRFEDLLRAPAELIGRGKNGSSYKVKLDGGNGVVVKRVKDWKISKDEFKKRMQKIDEIKHSNVLPVVAYYSSKQEKLVVYEYQQNGSLFRLLQGSQNGQIFDWASRLSIAASIADTLAFLHHKLQPDSIPHGNLKSSNILFKTNMEPSLSEYGLKLTDHHSPTQTTTTTADGFTVDVYAFGVILLELLTGKPVQTTRLDLAKWVSSVVKEDRTGEVFDKALVVEGASEERMVGLLQVALKCVNGSPELRPEMGLVAAMVAALREEEERSMASSDP